MTDDSPAKQCVFASIHDGGMRAAYVQSWSQGVSAGLFPVTFHIPNGPYIDAGRAIMGFEFLTNPQALPYDRLLTVDTDIAFGLEDVERLWDLCTPDTPVVAGAYVGSTADGHLPLVYQLADDIDDPFTQARNGMFVPVPVEKLAKGQGLIEAQATGLGFCMYHRSFIVEGFERWATEGGPWAEMHLPTMIDVHDRSLPIGLHIGEDLSFGLRLWSIGRKILVDTDIHLVHLKTMGLQVPEEGQPVVVAS